MNEIFNNYENFIIVYIDDILIFFENVDQYFKYINIFINIIRKNGLAVSPSKISLFQTKIRFLWFNIHNGTIIPINRSIDFASKFPNEIKDKPQLQRFLGSLNYVTDFFPNMNIFCKPLFDRLKKNPPTWTNEHTKVVQLVKEKIKQIPCLHIADLSLYKIVETDALDIGFGEILKQKNNQNKEEIIQFISKSWNDCQKNYSTISKFQGDLLNQKFLLRIDCKSAKNVLIKDVQNIVSK